MAITSPSLSSSSADEIVDLGGTIHPSFDDEATSSDGHGTGAEVVVVATAEENEEGADVKLAIRRKAILWPPLEKREGGKLVFPLLGP